MPRSMKGGITATDWAADAIAGAVGNATFWTIEMLKANNYGWALESARVVDQLVTSLARLGEDE